MSSVELYVLYAWFWAAFLDINQIFYIITISRFTDIYSYRYQFSGGTQAIGLFTALSVLENKEAKK